MQVSSSVVVKDLRLKDKEKDKDLMSKDEDKDEESSFKDKDKDFMSKDEDKDKNLSFEDKVGESYINYVSQFKYPGHIVSCDMTDDEDIEREIKNMFIRTNMLIRKFKVFRRSQNYSV